MFRIWPTNAQSTSHSYAYSQQTSAAKYYLSASLEMNGKVFMNHSQVESRILGSFIPRNDAFQTTWVPSAHTYQTSAIDQHQHFYAPAPQQPSLPQPPIYPIRRRTQPEQANVIQKIQISSLKKEGNGRPAAIEMSTGTDGGHLPVARPVYQNSPPTASAKSGHTASAPSDEQNLSAQLQELRDALDREAQDHADAQYERKVQGEYCPIHACKMKTAVHFPPLGLRSLPLPAAFCVAVPCCRPCKCAGPRFQWPGASRRSITAADGSTAKVT